MSSRPSSASCRPTRQRRLAHPNEPARSHRPRGASAPRAEIWRGIRLVENNGRTATAKDLKAGVRVVIDVEKGQFKEALVAKEVKIGSVDVIYTCPMHPEVQAKEPGKCPKCGMNLEPKA